MHEVNPVLMYSMAEFESIIKPLLAGLQPRSVCEIGVEKGRFTEFLLAFCRDNNCSYTGVDVLIEPQIVPLGNGTEAQYIRGRSLDVIPTLPLQDAYFIDGDHNYYTVINELRLIASGVDHASLLFLHDVGWPCGRRDMYYQPESIPTCCRNPCRSGVGPVPGQQALEEWGLGSTYADIPFSVAEFEGGVRNGVLTAIEDFLKGPEGAGWRLHIVPAVFGLGILYKPNQSAPAVMSYLTRLFSSAALFSDLLCRVEENRVQMFSSFLKSYQYGKDLAETHQTLQSEYAALQKHVAEVKKHLRELETHAGNLSKAYKELASHVSLVLEENKRLKEGSAIL